MLPLNDLLVLQNSFSTTNIVVRDQEKPYFQCNVQMTIVVKILAYDCNYVCVKKLPALLKKKNNSQVYS